MNNIEQFSLYTAKIFEELYDSFPIPKGLDQDKAISDCLSFAKHEELQDLKNKKDIAELLIVIGHEDAERIEGKLSELKHGHSALENEKYSEIYLQKAIFKSTLEFLLSEGLVREAKSGGYVLTAKAFSHLNKGFENGGIKDEDSTYIKAIKSIFSTDTAQKIGVGLAIKVVPSFLGIS
ncbi:hypothetical protein Q4561_18645 [Alteromonas sp. 1_MG-2023]|uniref:hypothetical protein n=1 Tax=Alteromonas sp. 1_MG-2023 TaxID=3062669 RepID=UPI0026E4401F|nr:hypothetical protein [Alteromonas sp. 1_MG-2023]MDO6569096.1 hypothetical protein [Alteromonas sp. 1_MG-2023]